MIQTKLSKFPFYSHLETIVDSNDDMDVFHELDRLEHFYHWAEVKWTALSQAGVLMNSGKQPGAGLRDRRNYKNMKPLWKAVWQFS